MLVGHTKVVYNCSAKVSLVATCKIASVCCVWETIIIVGVSALDIDQHASNRQLAQLPANTRQSDVSEANCSERGTSLQAVNEIRLLLCEGRTWRKLVKGLNLFLTPSAKFFNYTVASANQRQHDTRYYSRTRAQCKVQKKR